MKPLRNASGSSAGECSTMFSSEHITVRLLFGAGQIVYSQFTDVSLMKTAACLKQVEPR